MANRLSTAQQNTFRNLMRDAHDTFATKTITWKRRKSSLQRYGEDSDKNGFDDVSINVLPNYNYMRSWPVTDRNETGDQDKESVQILINKGYLKDLGYLDSNGYFDFDPGEDRFVMDGMNYTPVGDSNVSAWAQDDILIMIVLKRDETLTGKKR